MLWEGRCPTDTLLKAFLFISCTVMHAGRSLPASGTFTNKLIYLNGFNKDKQLTSTNLFSSASLRSPFCEEIVCCRGDHVRLAVRVRVFAYPESACAVWIMFACKYRSVLWQKAAWSFSSGLQNSKVFGLYAGFRVLLWVLELHVWHVILSMLLMYVQYNSMCVCVIWKLFQNGIYGYIFLNKFYDTLNCI